MARVVVVEYSIGDAPRCLTNFVDLEEVYITPSVRSVLDEAAFISAFASFRRLRVFSMTHEDDAVTLQALTSNFFSTLPNTIEELCISLSPAQTGPLLHLSKLTRLCIEGGRELSRLFSTPRGGRFMRGGAAQSSEAEWKKVIEEMDQYLPNHLAVRATFCVTDMYLNMGLKNVYLSIPAVAACDYWVPDSIWNMVKDRLIKNGFTDALVGPAPVSRARVCSDRRNYDPRNYFADLPCVIDSMLTDIAHEMTEAYGADPEHPPFSRSRLEQLYALCPPELKSIGLRAKVPEYLPKLRQ